MIRGKTDPYYLRFLEQLASLAPRMVKLTSDELKSKRIGQQRLRDVLEKRFTLSDLNELCFELGIDFENVSGSNKSEKVIYLIRYMGDRERYLDLFKAVQRLRPNSI